MPVGNSPKTEFDYYKLLIQEVWAQAKKDIPLPPALNVNEARSLALLIKQATERELHERTIRNAFKKAETETDFKLPAPYTLETLAQFVMGVNDPKMEASPTWTKFIVGKSREPAGPNADAQQLRPDIPPPPRNSSRRVKTWGLVLLLALIGAALVFQKSCMPPRDFVEEWPRTDPAYLASQGWQVLAPDQKWLSNQPVQDSGAFTLWTLPGDNWVKPGEKLQITNMLVHKVAGQDFEVIAGLRYFYPNQVTSQNFSLFLLDEKLDLENCIRQSIFLGNEPNVPQRVIWAELLDFERGRPTSMGYNPFVEVQPGIFNSFKQMTLRLTVKGNTVSADERPISWAAWYFVPNKITIAFKPAYIGIAAFQGWTKENGAPINAEIIPAQIDFVKINYQ